MSDGDGENSIRREMEINKIQEGDFQVRQVQQMGRIDVPDEFLEGAGFDIGVEVVVIYEGDKIMVRGKEDFINRGSVK